MRATGKRVGVEIIAICRFADGKLVEHGGLTDRLSLMQQLGIIPTPGEVAELRR